MNWSTILLLIFCGFAVSNGQRCQLISQIRGTEETSRCPFIVLPTNSYIYRPSEWMTFWLFPDDIGDDDQLFYYNLEVIDFNSVPQGLFDSGGGSVCTGGAMITHNAQPQPSKRVTVEWRAPARNRGDLFIRFSAGIRYSDGSVSLWKKCGQMILLKYYKDIPADILRGIDDPLGIGMPSPAPNRRPSQPTPRINPTPSTSNMRRDPDGSPEIKIHETPSPRPVQPKPVQRQPKPSHPQPTPTKQRSRPTQHKPPSPRPRPTQPQPKPASRAPQPPVRRPPPSKKYPQKVPQSKKPSPSQQRRRQSSTSNQRVGGYGPPPKSRPIAQSEVYSVRARPDPVTVVDRPSATHTNSGDSASIWSGFDDSFNFSDFPSFPEFDFDEQTKALFKESQAAFNHLTSFGEPINGDGRSWCQEPGGPRFDVLPNTDCQSYVMSPDAGRSTHHCGRPGELRFSVISCNCVFYSATTCYV